MNKRKRLNSILERQAEILAEYLAIFPEAESEEDVNNQRQQTIINGYRDLESGFFSMIELSGQLLIDKFHKRTQY